MVEIGILISLKQEADVQNSMRKFALLTLAFRNWLKVLPKWISRDRIIGEPHLVSIASQPYLWH